MAAPIAHIFLAVQMLAGLFYGLFDEKEFIIGTSFPDIRYLKVISREETHATNITLHDIMQEKDSFKAGMLFHAFVDEQREKYIVEQGFYEKLSDFKFVTQSLKFAEDEILRSLFDAAAYCAYFNIILKQEKAYNIAVKDIKRWHMFLKEYCSNNCSCKDLMMKYFDVVDPHAWWIKRWLFMQFYAYKMEKVVSFIVKDKWAKKAILNFYMNFAKKYT